MLWAKVQAVDGIKSKYGVEFTQPPSDFIVPFEGPSALTQPVLDDFELIGESSYLNVMEFGTHCNFSCCFDFWSYNTF